MKARIAVIGDHMDCVGIESIAIRANRCTIRLEEACRPAFTIDISGLAATGNVANFTTRYDAVDPPSPKTRNIETVIRPSEMAIPATRQLCNHVHAAGCWIDPDHGVVTEIASVQRPITAECQPVWAIER